MRATSSTRSAGPSTSRRQVGTRHVAAFDGEAQAAPGSARCSLAGTSSAAERRACGRNRTSTLRLIRSAARRRAISADASPPQMSRIRPVEDRQALVEEGRIDAALEPAARVAGEAERLPGARRSGRGVEPGDLEHHVDGVVGRRPESSPPMIPPMSWTLRVVGDDASSTGRAHILCRSAPAPSRRPARRARSRPALQLRDVISVERAGRGRASHKLVMSTSAEIGR